MLITGFPAGMFQTNCYLVATGGGSEAVIIDPGQDAAPTVRSLLAEHELTPVAVLLTHGHLDHTWNAQELSDEYSIPAYIHTDDRPMLADPGKGIGRALGAMIGDTVFREPEKVIEFVDGEAVEIAGIRFTVDLAPGHTRGSVLLGIEVPVPVEDTGPDTPETVPVCFSGDVLFAGSIGRTDLPGGDHQQLLDSIAAKLLPLPDHTQVLPGHGPQTSIGAERATNPFLVDLPGASKKGRYGL
ncbi:MBL fold metallo-hydrolase [Gordonia sp. ABSL1-1]|uniref:MBL fold metallo-hydrolase n=1 Tax=Gordonia sp. ABSL1-1 TaxID=3053923 RepID=UPI002573764F|nr:MBL fold metallo-hydrolase [Gordonia sp. ABSL1-1]MDL9936443.1 MBL fold metallo-hydrolase [Gordonia sp. ABSL1-1]